MLRYLFNISNAGVTFIGIDVEGKGESLFISFWLKHGNLFFESVFKITFLTIICHGTFFEI